MDRLKPSFVLGVILHIGGMIPQLRGGTVSPCYFEVFPESFDQGIIPHTRDVMPHSAAIMFWQHVRDYLVMQSLASQFQSWVCTLELLVYTCLVYSTLFQSDKNLFREHM